MGVCQERIEDQMLEGLTPPQNKAVYCKVNQLEESLEQSDSEIFITAINNPQTWSANSLSTALRQKGVSLADTTIAKHRNKTCACFRA